MASEQILDTKEYMDRHKRAFRVAFDFLNAHFPPENTEEWWIKAAEDLSDASVEAGEDELVLELLAGVYTYLGKENKLRWNSDGKTEG